jgi:hypothetical protein
MDRIETPQVLNGKQCRVIKERIIQPHQLKALDNLPSAADRRRPMLPHRTHDLDSRE